MYNNNLELPSFNVNLKCEYCVISINHVRTYQQLTIVIVIIQSNY